MCVVGSLIGVAEEIWRVLCVVVHFGGTIARVVIIRGAFFVGVVGAQTTLYEGSRDR